MTFLLDHCIWKETETFLRNAGFTCVTLRELGKCEAANGELIILARQQNAVLITRDRDFSNLSLYPLGKHNGIILLRITPLTIEPVHKNLSAALQSFPPAQLCGSLLIITSTTFRLHRQAK